MATAIFQVPGLRIKSIQRGVISLTGGTGTATGTATITAVTTAKSMINLLGAAADGSGYIGANLTLTNTTTVTATSVALATVNLYVSFEVVEFY